MSVVLEGVYKGELLFSLMKIALTYSFTQSEYLDGLSKQGRSFQVYSSKQGELFLVFKEYSTLRQLRCNGKSTVLSIFLNSLLI